MLVHKVNNRPIYGIFRSSADVARHAANTHAHNNVFSIVTAIEFMVPMNSNHDNDCKRLSNTSPAR